MTEQSETWSIDFRPYKHAQVEAFSKLTKCPTQCLRRAYRDSAVHGLLGDILDTGSAISSSGLSYRIPSAIQQTWNEQKKPSFVTADRVINDQGGTQDTHDEEYTSIDRHLIPLLLSITCT